MKQSLLLAGLCLLVSLAVGCGSELGVDANSLSAPQDNGAGSVPLGTIVVAGEEEQVISLYFLDPQGAYLFPLSLSYNQDASAKDLAKHLASGPMRKEWGQTPIPSGVTIKGIDMVGERALVDFKTGSSFSQFEQHEEELMVKGLIYTLTSLESVSRVEFLQEGEEPGEPFQLLAQQNLFTRESLALNPLEPGRSHEETCVLWFSNQDVLYMVPVSVAIEEMPADPLGMALLLINALIEGPGDSFNLLSAFPEGTEVLSLKIEGQTIEVDFNRLFVTNFGGGSALEWAILNSLVLTLTEIEGIEEVQVLVEGRKEDAALGHMETAQPLIRGVVNWVLAD